VFEALLAGLSRTRLGALWEGAPGAGGGTSGGAAHPHRRALAWERPRRPGAVAAREQPCLCPVVPGPRRRREHDDERARIEIRAR
jgi:hypothetical protein